MTWITAMRSRWNSLSIRTRIGAVVLLHILLFVLLQSGPISYKLSWRPQELLYLLPWLLSFGMPGPHLLAPSLGQLALLIGHWYSRDAVSIVSLSLATLPPAIYGLWKLFTWSWREIQTPASRKALGFSLFSWLLLALAYPPLPLGPLAPILLVPWFLVLLREPPGRALFATTWAAIAHNAAMYWWIYNVMKVGPAPVILGGLALLVLYLSGFQVLGAWVLLRLRLHRWMLWSFPLFWAGLEVWRTSGEFSFPWAHLGYTMGDHWPLLSALPLIGVFGYSGLLMYSNLAAAHIWLHKAWKRPMRAAGILATGVVCLALFSLNWLAGTWKDPAYPGTETASFALVQPNIAQTKKWSKNYYDSVMAKTWSMLDTLETGDLDLVVLPETAVPDFFRLRDEDWTRFRRYAGGHGVSVLVGGLDYDRKGPMPRRFRYFNSAFLFAPDGTVLQYRKNHLVPFSERLPFDDVFPVLNYVDLGEGDFSPDSVLPVWGESLQWVPHICYESIYPDLMRRTLDVGARVVVNITNDAWFGRSTAPGQHANLVRFRAAEEGIPVARCANSGISVFYDARGQELGRTRLLTESVMRGTLALRNQRTPYSRYGAAMENTLFWLAWVLLAATIGFSLRKSAG